MTGDLPFPIPILAIPEYANTYICPRCKTEWEVYVFTATEMSTCPEDETPCHPIRSYHMEDIDDHDI